MERVSLYSIMSDSIKNIYSIISESDNISRLEISRKTSLSLMTVGKVVDSLLELGVIRQIKKNAPLPDARRALSALTMNIIPLSLIFQQKSL